MATSTEWPEVLADAIDGTHEGCFGGGPFKNTRLHNVRYIKLHPSSLPSGDNLEH